MPAQDQLDRAMARAASAQEGLSLALDLAHLEDGMSDEASVTDDQLVRELQQQVAAKAAQEDRLMGLLEEQQAVSAGYKQQLEQALEQVRCKVEVIEALKDALHRAAGAAVIAGATIQMRRSQDVEQDWRRQVEALSRSNGERRVQTKLERKPIPDIFTIMLLAQQHRLHSPLQST
jgi:hypothetical protein